MAPKAHDPRRKLPNGIPTAALPPRVHWDTMGRGRWVLRQTDPQTGKRQSIRLGGAELTLRELLEAYEGVTQAPPTDTMASLVARFEASQDWAGLAKLTQDDYRYCAKSILSAVTKRGGKVADTKPGDWTPGSVRTYIDRRAETSKSRANHELRYLCRLFAWAREREIVPTNPALGVRSVKVTTKARYVTDAEYESFLAFAATRSPYLAPMAELAYLCRLRLSEVCDLRRTDITDEGLLVDRRKDSKDGLTFWTPRLRAAVDACLALHGKTASVFLVPGASRGRMREDTFKTAWGRAMRAWAEQGNRRFLFHDTKRKGISDVKGDKMAAGGHRSAAMLRIYDLSRAEAPATR